MRLEAVIVGGVEHDTALARILLEPRQHGGVIRHQRLFDERVLAVFDEIVEQFDFGGVGGAQQRGIERIERDFASNRESQRPHCGHPRSRRNRPPRNADAYGPERQARQQ